LDSDSFKRMLMTMVLAVAIFVGYQHFFGRKDEKRPPAPPPVPVAAVPTPAATDADADGDPAKATVPAPYTVKSAPPEDISSYRGPMLGDSAYLGDYAMAVRLTARGAGIEHVELSDYFESVGDRDKAPAARRKFQLIQDRAGLPGYVLTRLDITRKGANQAETVRLDLPLSKPLADLNAGRGVRKGTVILSNGVKSVLVDVSACKTIGDVLHKINTNGVVPISASRHPTLDALILSGGESGRISVREQGEGHAAADLGILRAMDTGEDLVGTSLGADPWWTIEGTPTKDEARFRLDVDHDGKPLLTFRKTLRLTARPAPQTFGDRFAEPKAFAIEMALTIEDHSKTLSMVKFTLRGPEGLVCEETRGDGRVVVGGYVAKDGETIFKSPGDAAKADSRALGELPLDWAGVVNKYFAFVAVADPERPFERFSAAEAYPTATSEGEPGAGVVLMSLDRPLDEQTHILSANYLLFAGPKDSGLLSKPIYQRRGLVKLVQWSQGCCCNVPLLGPLIEGISKFMVMAIDRIADFVVNKGLAVIILVMLVRLLMLPISRYSQLSMLKMQDLQPEIAKLKERLKDDKQALQVEQMKLMRERGVNPMMGCLPMMLQMPIWIALYSGIRVAIGLRQAPFMLWITDLARPDALMTFDPVTTPIVSWIGGWAQWQLNVLPILMVIMFFMQMKMQPQAASASPEAAKQQKMMKWMMPGMMFFFFYTAPSALNLYIMTSSFVGFWEQKYIRWHHGQIKLRPPKPRKEKSKGRFAQWMEKKVENARHLQDQARKSEPRWDKKKRGK
jgi:YidC/Oxa1 family membrane protein insertase